MTTKQDGDDEDMTNLIYGPLCAIVYTNLIGRCKSHVRSLTTVQFDPETGIRRHFFNGRLEGTITVRGIKKNP